MLQFWLDESRCTYCGECARDCISGIIEQHGENPPRVAAENEERCLRCQHCLAVCPSGAISILGKRPEGSLPILEGCFPSFEQLANLVRGRRSVRHYRQENVDPELLNRILSTLANVPTGANACGLTFTVIDDIEVMQRLQQKTISLIRSAAVDNAMPEPYQAMLEISDDSLRSMLFRSAPHVIVASAPPNIPCPAEDTALAIANFELLAQSAGLGSVWWGFMRMFVRFVPGIKLLFDIPEDHITSAALFGYPAIKFARTVQKDDAAVIRRISF